ncbi:MULTISPECIES: hypothetical protein [Acinetobacter]|uniref:DUF7946 domain-containing protein n=1 Tax=Acinetobacter TaxID=469 RepID=UPI001444280F|nr:MULTISPECIES: hypothetical protein [Acinetobacter]MDM1244075.1 hypothetical protein [Acinetobacter indicus]MDM1288128.1 hypothetical protein [Acinetobacter indicus]
MTDNAQSIKFKLSYQNGTADDHHLDMYDAAISYLGFAKAINITVNAILNKQVKVKGNQSGGFKVYLDTSKKGSFEQFITIIIDNPSLTASTIVLGASGSALWDGIKYVFGGVLGVIQPKPPKKIMDRIEPILDDLHQALETPLQEAHRPIVNDDEIEIEITSGRKQGVIKLDKNTLREISSSTSQKIEVRKGNVTKFSNISYIGRYYDEELDKTESFHSEALTQYEQELLVWSLHESLKDINKGKLEITVIPIKTKTGKLKRYDFLEVKKA